MNQVYLLLRNNEQSGPYSFDELPGLQLTEKDFVKVAGTNSGWYYPYELGLPFTLSSRLNKTETQPEASADAKEDQLTPDETASQPQPSSVPADDVDQAIEELSKKITAIRNNLKMVEVQIHAEKEIQHKPKATGGKKARPKKLLWPLLIAAAALVTLSVFAYLKFADVKAGNLSTAAQNKPVIEFVTEEESSGAVYEEETNSIAGTFSGTTNALTDSASKAMAVQKAKTPPKKKPRPTRNKNNGLKPVAGENQSQRASPENPGDDEKIALNYVMPEEERKTLLQKIVALFKKEEPLSTDANPITEETIYDKLKINVGTTNYSWLKGVQGLTLTLTNNSSQAVKRATVNVVYYTRQNRVIEKTTVHFTNVKPGKSQSVAAPDHQWADHAGYEIVAVSVVKK